jgi:hypothetical protein
MFPNPTCKISNYIIEPDGTLYNLYLSPEMQQQSGIRRCLATAETVTEIINFIHTRQGDLRDTDILVEFDSSTALQLQYFIVANNPDNLFVLFVNVNYTRKSIDEDEDIDSLIQRHTDKNLIVQF